MAMAVASEPSSSCPVCRGTGWKMVPAAADSDYATSAVRCECQLAHRAEELLADAAIPSRYQHCTLDNFDLPDGNRELLLAHRQAVAYARDYPGMIDRDRSGLLLLGSVGTGKTHLAVAVVRQLLDRGIACRFCDYRELLKRIQATFDPANPATESSVVNPLLQVEVLLLDDLGVGRATEWAMETLHFLLNHRYSHRLATLVTTNLEDGDTALDRKDITLVQSIGERLRSRLYEMCVFIPMHGGDFRRATAAPLVR